MLTIGQVASRTGLRASAIRYYEAQGLLPKPTRQAGKRIYSTSILERLAVIELAKVAGFELRDIRAMLSEARVSEPSAAWKKLASAKGADIDEQMKRLIEMKRVLSKLTSCTCATLEECGRAFVEARSKR